MTFRVIPGLNQASELGEAVLPPEMTRKAIPKWFFIVNELLFVIANSTSILHACLNVITMTLCSAWHKLFLMLIYMFLY
jgi:hypothetical protein